MGGKTFFQHGRKTFVFVNMLIFDDGCNQSFS